MQVRLLALVVAVGAVVAIDGCGDPTAIKAQFNNIDTTRTVYALNGTPATVPAGLLIRTVQPVRVDANFAFDLAFDFNAAGDVVVYTVRAVASQLASSHRVGLLATSKTFDEATDAPTGGYAFDSSMVVPVGQTVLIDATDNSCSQFSILGQDIRAKMVIDSAKVSTRTIFVHVLSNPNCGFRSLVRGEPKN
jgi:hypothetical protein